MLFVSMSWYRKEDPTFLDTQTIEGLLFLDGDLVASVMGREWSKGMKFPLIEFPSGTVLEIWETGAAHQSGILHLFGEMDLPLQGSRDEGLAAARKVAQEVGYTVLAQGETQLAVIGHDPDEHVIVTYDNQQRRIVDVAQVTSPSSEPSHPAMELLDQASRERLPALYSNEAIGLDAPAQVKFFTPDGGFTWYASEGSPVDENGYFDTDKAKVDFLFFGLVIGLEIELGYFSLSELSSVRGGLGLPVERDTHFQPTTLRELKSMHEKDRE
jgi:hypothetical protein